jgi:hypothetical protein
MFFELAFENSAMQRSAHLRTSSSAEVFTRRRFVIPSKARRMPLFVFSKTAAKQFFIS